MSYLFQCISDKLKSKNAMRAVIAILSIMFFFMYVTAITFIVIPEGNMRFVDIVLGALIATVIGSVYAYFYGTTQGSADKNEMIKNSNNNSNGSNG